MPLRSLPSEISVAPQNASSVGAMPWSNPPRMSAALEPEGIPWARYIDATKRNWFLIVAVTLLGSAAGLFAARSVRPLYDAEATVWINTTPTITQTGPIRQQQFGTTASWVELLRS